MRIWLVVIASVCVGAGVAIAQEDPSTAPPPPPPIAPPPPSAAPPPAAPVIVQPLPAPVVVSPGVDPGTLEDANSGRVAIMSTALTPPAGTWAFEDWELLLISASYAPTDRLVITATTMVPVVSGFYPGFISAKLQVVNQGPLRIALQAGTGGLYYPNGDSSSTTINGVTTTTTSSDSTGALEIGGALTYCLDGGCFSHIDASATAAFAYQSASSVPVIFSGGIVARLARHIRLVAEADTAHLFGDLSGQANGLLAWYGLRFTSRQIGVDLELVKPLCGDGDCDTDSFPLGFPFVTFTYRGLD